MCAAVPATWTAMMHSVVVNSDECLVALGTGPRHKLADLSDTTAARLPGIYALWHDDTLLYVGMVRKDPRDTTNPQAAGLLGRLDTYRRAPLTQTFTVAVAFRYVVPFLPADERLALGSGELTVTDIHLRVRSWIGQHVAFSTVVTDAEAARAAERTAHRSGIPGAGVPPFNKVR